MHRDTVTAAVKGMPAHAWWSTFGGSIPELQNVADLDLWTASVIKQVAAVIVATAYIAIVTHPSLNRIYHISIVKFGPYYRS